MSKLVLGLDLGAASVGWALLRVPGNQRESGEVVAMGSRVFPEGTDRDTKGLEKSKTVQRREARGSRRIKQRRKQRRRRLIATLLKADLLPDGDEALRTVLAGDPYPLRAKGLDQKLTAHELGRVLYHLNKRRGFKSNRKGGKSKEDGTVYESIQALTNQIGGAGCRTLGEYLNKLVAKPGERPEVRVRCYPVSGLYTLRAMYEQEFDKLWAAQQPHHADKLTPELARELKENVLFFQRPLRSAQHLVGYCELEPEEQRCPRGRWEAQQFIMLQELNHLRRIDTSTGEEKELTLEDRAKLYEKLCWNREIKMDAARDLLGWPEHHQCNLEHQGKRRSLKGNAVGDILRKALKEKEVKKLGRAQLIEIGAKLDEEEDFARLKAHALHAWRFSEEQVEALLKAAASLPERHLMVSLKSIEKMLPYLEEGYVISKAKELAGYKRRDEDRGEGLPALPLPFDRRGQPLTNNPVVQKTLFEVRKVINALIQVYGKPDEIVIEMARECRGSIDERNDRNIEMRKREKQRDAWKEQIRSDFAEFKDRPPRRDDTLKYELWLECGKTCPYTGQQISARQLFSGEVQIEHILPYSRSLDDSFMNKALCFHAFNAEKGNRTPFEFFAQTSKPKWQKRWEEIQVWAKNHREIPWAKRRRFLQKEIDTDKFIQRQLNDTRYISVVARDFVAGLCPQDRTPLQYVRCARGDLTAKLRWDWGLESVLDTETKNREDHRHHAVDAVVVALTDSKRVVLLTQNDETRRTRGLDIRSRDKVPDPWPVFRDQVKAKVNAVIVSHKPTRKVSGPLHEETFYGPTKRPGVFAVRKPVEALTKDMIENIRDETIRGLVKSRCTLDAQGQVVEIPKDAFKTPLHMQSGVPVKKVRIGFVSEKIVEIRPKTFVKPGENHHVAIYQNGESILSNTVTRFEAALRLSKGIPVVSPVHSEDSKAKLLFSICINDVLEIPKDNGAKILWRVQQLWEKQIQLRPITYAGPASNKEGRWIPAHKTVVEMGARKVSIDPLGRIAGYPRD